MRVMSIAAEVLARTTGLAAQWGGALPLANCNA